MDLNEKKNQAYLGFCDPNTKYVLFESEFDFTDLKGTVTVPPMYSQIYMNEIKCKIYYLELNSIIVLKAKATDFFNV